MGDSHFRQKSEGRMREMMSGGTTVLMVTHEHDLVKRFPRRVIEIQGGTVVGDTGSEVRDEF